MPAPLRYWFIPLKASELEIFVWVTWKIRRLFVNTLNVDDKYSLLSGDNSMQAIQLLLSQKENIFSGLFSSFFKSTLNFEHFLKNRILITYVFLKLSPWKEELRKCIKTPVWEERSTGGMVNWPKHWFNLNASVFTILIDH